MSDTAVLIALNKKRSIHSGNNDFMGILKKSDKFCGLFVCNRAATILSFIREEGFYEYEGIGLHGVDFGNYRCN